MSRTRSVRNYSSFVNQLHSDRINYSTKPKEEWINEALKYVDGLAAEELRRLVKLETRRMYGAFFTPGDLAAKVVQNLFPSLDENSVIYDPACGAGNLLLPVLQQVKEKRIIPKKNYFLLGTDIHQEFVDAANSRLSIMQLILKSESENVFHLNRFKVKKGDGLLGNEFFGASTHVFVNPPFNLMATPMDINWAKGAVSAAAVFIDHIIKNVTPSATIVAILPEVLRCGSRYSAWRQMVLQNCVNEKVELLGRFDKFANVDVFAIRLRKREKINKQKQAPAELKHSKSQKRTIEDHFTVCVGPVVDNRDPLEGRKRGYIVSRGLPGWSIQNNYTHTRNHSGKSFNGPFIVIKRTSRMGDSQRAIATIINTRHPVYVDNHLIVLQPKAGTIEACIEAIQILKDPRTDFWLNNQIRCRHLTVKVVSKIPIWE